MGDPVALSRLELHRLAARTFDRDPDAARAFPVERIRSLTATGRAGEALDLARTLAPRPEHDLALALSAFDPALALTKYAGPDASLRAALKLAAGREDDARRALETLPARRPRSCAPRWIGIIRPGRRPHGATASGRGACRRPSRLIRLSRSASSTPAPRPRPPWTAR